MNPLKDVGERHVFGEKRWRATAVQDASRSRKPSPFAPASWTAPALWRFGPGQATCARVRMMRHVFCGNALVSYKERDFLTGCQSRKPKSAPRISRMIFRQERLHRAVGISRIEHLRRGIGHVHASVPGGGEMAA
jgi:hypothetical protein